MRRPLANTTAIVHRPSRSAVPLPPITLTRTSFLPSLWISPGLVRSRLSPRCNVLGVTPWIRQNSPRDRPLVPNSLTSRWTSCRVRRRRDLTSSGSVIRPLQQITPRNGRCVSKAHTMHQRTIRFCTKEPIFISLPGLSGLELRRRLAESSSSTPVVFLLCRTIQRFVNRPETREPLLIFLSRLRDKIS